MRRNYKLQYGGVPKCILYVNIFPQSRSNGMFYIHMLREMHRANPDMLGLPSLCPVDTYQDETDLLCFFDVIHLDWK